MEQQNEPESVATRMLDKTIVNYEVLSGDCVILILDDGTRLRIKADSVFVGGGSLPILALDIDN